MDRVARRRYGSCVVPETNETLTAEQLLAARFLSRSDFATADAPPSRIGEYVVEGELGRGGMGVVFAARDQALDRRVAIKRPAGAFTPAAIERFVREGRAAARLHHPHIVSTLHAGHDERGPYLVLEWIDGETLAETLEARGPFDFKLAATLMRQAALAAEHAHAAGVLHRDIKAENLLLRPDGSAALTDFGLAKLLDTDGPTAAGEVLGSPSSISPEQVRGDVSGPRADVYGLGATLYALLTGHPPFQGDSVWATLNQVADAPPEPPSRRRPDLPRPLEAIVLRCLEKDPTHRYASARALADDLERFLQGEPVLARPPGLGRRLGRWARRQRVRLLLLAVVAAVGLAAFAGRSSLEARRWAEADQLLIEAAAGARHHQPPAQVAARVERALALHPARRLRIRAARIYQALDRLDAARSVLEASIAQHPPGYEELLLLHGLERGRPISEPLLRLLREADARGDSGPLIQWARGKRALAEGDLSGAIEWFTRAIDAGVPAHLERGVARRRRGDFAGAQADFERARKDDPRHPWPVFNLGILAYQAGDARRARDLFDQTLLLRPNFGPGRTWRGLARLAQANIAGACADFEAAAILTDAPPEARTKATLQLLLLRSAALLGPASGWAARVDLGPAAPSRAALARGELLRDGR